MTSKLRPIGEAPHDGTVITLTTYTIDSYGMTGSAYWDGSVWRWRADYEECFPQPEYWIDNG